MKKTGKKDQFDIENELNLWMFYYKTVREHTTSKTTPIKEHESLKRRKERENY